MNTLIIAEAGVNHNGHLLLARDLIDAAAMAGADLVKFQTFSAAHLVTPKAQKAAYQARLTPSSETQYQMLKRLALAHADHQALIDHCHAQGIGFFSTGFTLEDVDFLISLGLSRIKIPSGEITNLPYLRHIGQYNLPVFLSTGMSTLGEVETALNILEQSGTDHEKITVMHCTSQYPTPIADVNLRAMTTIRDAFGVKVGYSDHTDGIEVPVAAVALGASVIEKHITINRNLPGPDHAASIEPKVFQAMVSAIRKIELAMGNPRKGPTSSELSNLPVVRKSIVAALPIKPGEIFTENNLAIKRPGTGLSPMYWDQVIGRTARYPLSQGDEITLDAI